MSDSQKDAHVVNKPPLLHTLAGNIVAITVAVLRTRFTMQVDWIYWWPYIFCEFLILQVGLQFMVEIFGGQNKFSQVPWDLVFRSAFKYTVIACPMLWVVTIYINNDKCGDLKGPVAYFCPDNESALGTVEVQDMWNSDTAAWLIFLPLTVIKVGIYDLVMDFFFYVQHRMYHEIPWLYRTIHKLHHTHTHGKGLKTWHTLHMSYLEVFLNFAACHFPALIITAMLFGSSPLTRINGLDVGIALGYIVLGELLGHADSTLDFPIEPAQQLFTMLGFPGYHPRHHALHHTATTCNYGKRGGVWDFIFGTFVEPEGGVGSWRKARDDHTSRSLPSPRSSMQSLQFSS